MKYNIPDVDLDCSEDTRSSILTELYHIPASKINEKGIFPHNVGIYLHNIPEDRITKLASIDYKDAEEKFGYIKYDILHNTVYDMFKSRDEIEYYLKQDVNWNLLYKEDILKQIPHINNYYTLLNQLPKISSIEELSMFIAIIRPGKKYLIDDVKKYGWESIKNRIWLKETDGYMYKKSHAISYSLLITLVMNKINTDIKI